jgi:hypothetical protein
VQVADGMKAYHAMCCNNAAMIDKGMVVLQNCLDSQKDVVASQSEACGSSSHSGAHAVNIKVEDFSDIEDREVPVPMTVVGIKAEHEVSCMSLCPLLGISESHPELPVLSLSSAEVICKYMCQFDTENNIIVMCSNVER